MLSNFVLILAVLSGPPFGAPVSGISEASLKFDEHRVKVVESGVVEPETGSVLYSWRADKPLDLETIDDEGRRVAIDGPPGTYELESEAIVARINEDAATKDKKPIVFSRHRWRVEIVIVPARPRPPPPKPIVPDPKDDDEDVPPDARPATVLILRSSDDTFEERTTLLRIRQSPTFETGTPALIMLELTAKLPDGSPDPIVTKYRDKIGEGAGFPYFFAVDSERRIIDSGEVGDADSFVSRIDKMLR